jgi:hypothetical protein
LVPATRGLCSLQGSRFVVCRRHPRPCDDPPRRPLPASEAPKQAATHRPPSSAPSGGGTSSSAGKGAVVRPQQQSASVVDLLPKTALVQAARRLTDVPSHAMLIFKQQPCSRREVEEEAKKDKVKSSHPGPRSGRTRAFFRAGLSFCDRSIESERPTSAFHPGLLGERNRPHSTSRRKRRKTRVFHPARVLQDAVVKVLQIDMRWGAQATQKPTLRSAPHHCPRRGRTRSGSGSTFRSASHFFFQRIPTVSVQRTPCRSPTFWNKPSI